MDVGMINWGFVLGRTQTNFPWDSWQRPYILQQPAVWIGLLALVPLIPLLATGLYMFALPYLTSRGTARGSTPASQL